MEKKQETAMRGPRGQRGASGLSAYGVWLRQGNVGTEQDFLNALRAHGDVRYFSHTGGQLVKSRGPVALCGRTDRPAPLGAGAYLVRYYAAGNGLFALYANGKEINGTRFFMTHGAVAEVWITMDAPAVLFLVNVGEGPVLLAGDLYTLDAYMVATCL